jgi:hypothetical protein
LRAVAFEALERQRRREDDARVMSPHKYWNTPAPSRAELRPETPKRDRHTWDGRKRR